MSAVRVVVGVYLLIVLLLVVFQRQMLYWPTKMPMGAAQKMAADQGFSPWFGAGDEFMGWRLPAPVPAKGSVLVVHGNGGTALYEMGLAETINGALGMDAYLLEYPGFGPRGGKATEASLLAAADEAFEHVPTNRPVYVVSESLGTGVAAHLAQKYPARVAGLVMFVPYDRLAAVAQSQYPYVPAYFLLWDRYDPADWLKDYRGPVKIVVAGADEVIPPERGKKLYENYPGPKSLEIIVGAGHGGTFGRSAQWWRELLAFWQANEPKN